MNNGGWDCKRSRAFPSGTDYLAEAFELLEDSPLLGATVPFFWFLKQPYFR
jgi:hypothetical protein